MGGLDPAVGPSPGRVGHLTPPPEREGHDRTQDPGGHDARDARLPDLGLRQERMLRKVVGLGLVHEDELGVVAPYAARAADLGRPVDKGVGVALGVQLGDALFGHLLQLFDLAELMELVGHALAQAGSRPSRWRS